MMGKHSFLGPTDPQEPLQQPHVRQVRQTRLPGAHDRLAQRVPASQMEQERAQQALDRLVLAQPLQCSGVLCQLPPVCGQKRHQHFPVLVQSCQPPPRRISRQ